VPHPLDVRVGTAPGRLRFGGAKRRGAGAGNPIWAWSGPRPNASSHRTSRTSRSRHPCGATTTSRSRCTGSRAAARTASSPVHQSPSPSRWPTAGARGGTEAQMAQTPNFLPQEGQHPTFDALDRRASRSESEEGDSGTPFRLNVANAVRGQRGHRLEGPHPDTLARHHGAGLQTRGLPADGGGHGGDRQLGRRGDRGPHRGPLAPGTPSNRIRAWS
jgi:hypothetical protein